MTNPTQASLMSKTLLQINLSGTILTQYGPDGSTFLAPHWTAAANLHLDEPLQSPTTPEEFSKILLAVAPLISQIAPTPKDSPVVNPPTGTTRLPSE